MKNLLYASLSGILFILMGIGIYQYSLWSGITNYSIPWLCSVIGLSVGLLGIHQFASEKNIKKAGHWCIWGVVIIIACAAVIVDALTYANGCGTMDILVNLLEVAGFGVVYFVLLLILF